MVIVEMVVRSVPVVHVSGHPGPLVVEHVVSVPVGLIEGIGISLSGPLAIVVGSLLHLMVHEVPSVSGHAGPLVVEHVVSVHVVVVPVVVPVVPVVPVVTVGVSISMGLIESISISFSSSEGS